MTASGAVQFPHDLIKIRQGSFRLKAFKLRYQSRFAPSVPRTDSTRTMLWTFDVELSSMVQESVVAFEGWLANVEFNDFAFHMHDPYRNGLSGVGGGFSETSDELLFENTSSEFGSFASDLKILQGATFGTLSGNVDPGERTLLCEGLPVSSQIASRGDHIGIGPNLYMVNNTVRSDASGFARFDFLDGLWLAAKAGDPVNFRRPTARFVLADKETGQVVRDTDNFGHASLMGIEYPDQGLPL